MDTQSCGSKQQSEDCFCRCVRPRAHGPHLPCLHVATVTGHCWHGCSDMSRSDVVYPFWPSSEVFLSRVSATHSAPTPDQFFRVAGTWWKEKVHICSSTAALRLLFFSHSPSSFGVFFQTFLHCWDKLYLAGVFQDFPTLFCFHSSSRHLGYSVALRTKRSNCYCVSKLSVWDSSSSVNIK